MVEGTRCDSALRKLKGTFHPDSSICRDVPRQKPPLFRALLTRISQDINYACEREPYGTVASISNALDSALKRQAPDVGESAREHRDLLQSYYEEQKVWLERGRWQRALELAEKEVAGG